MPGVDETDGDSIRGRNRFFIGTGPEEGKRLLRVLHGIRRHIEFLSGPLRLPVAPDGLLLRDMSGIHEHDLAQFMRRPGCVDRRAVSARDQFRNLPGVIDMRVRQKDKIDRTGRDRQLGVFKEILSLLHPAVDKKALPAGGHKGAGTGHFMSRSDKLKFQGYSSLSDIILRRHYACERRAAAFSPQKQVNLFSFRILTSIFSSSIGTSVSMNVSPIFAGACASLPTI